MTTVFASYLCWKCGLRFDPENDANWLYDKSGAPIPAHTGHLCYAIAGGIQLICVVMRLMFPLHSYIAKGK